MSYPILLQLTALPRLVPALLIAGVAIGGLALPPPFGPILIGVVAFFVAWLTYLSWPATRPGARALRLLLLGLIVAGALAPVLLP